MSESTTSPNYIGLAADIVSAYVSNNSLPTSELPALLGSIHAALTATAMGQVEEPKIALTPAVSIKKSVTPDYLVCLDDGKKFRSLKRHLRTTKLRDCQLNGKRKSRSKGLFCSDYPIAVADTTPLEATRSSQRQPSGSNLNPSGPLAGEARLDRPDALVMRPQSLPQKNTHGGSKKRRHGQQGRFRISCLTLPQAAPWRDGCLLVFQTSSNGFGLRGSLRSRTLPSSNTYPPVP